MYPDANMITHIHLPMISDEMKQCHVFYRPNDQREYTANLCQFGQNDVKTDVKCQQVTSQCRSILISSLARSVTQESVGYLRNKRDFKEISNRIHDIKTITYVTISSDVQPSLACQQDIFPSSYSLLLTSFAAILWRKAYSVRAWYVH